MGTYFGTHSHKIRFRFLFLLSKWLPQFPSCFGSKNEQILCDTRSQFPIYLNYPKWFSKIIGFSTNTDTNVHKRVSSCSCSRLIRNHTSLYTSDCALLVLVLVAAVMPRYVLSFQSNLPPQKKGSRFCHRTKACIRTWYFEHIVHDEIGRKPQILSLNILEIPCTNPRFLGDENHPLFGGQA